MIFLFGLLSLGHILFYMILSWRWMRLSVYADGNHPTFSVIIPARNEEDCIQAILHDLQNQKYDKSKFEVIVVDDFSNDQTRNRISDFILKSPLEIHLISLENPKEQGKKHALTAGIVAAKHDIILTTDADCRVGENWMEAFASAFTEETQIVAGPVALIGKGLFAKMQMTEFGGLIAFGGVTLSYNNPSMCSGANLAFRKQAFEEVGGYESNMNIPSGDDEFLLYDIIKKYPSSGRFLKSHDAIVNTFAQSTLKTFINQRFRWSSKWKHNKNWKLRATAILFFLDYLILIAALIAAILGKFSWPIFVGIFGLRVLSNLVLLKSAGKFLGNSHILRSSLPLQIIYPFHVLFMGVLSIFGRYTWKGRRY